MALTKIILVDVDSSQFARKLQAAGEAYVITRLKMPQPRCGREAWRFETWLIRQLMEDVWDRHVTNHYFRDHPDYLGFKNFVQEVWPTFEQDYTFCFWSTGLQSSQFDMTLYVEYNRWDIILLAD